MKNREQQYSIDIQNEKAVEDFKNNLKFYSARSYADLGYKDPFVTQEQKNKRRKNYRTAN